MFVADLHNDLVQRVIEGEDVTKFTPHGHTDIPRLLESKIDLEILIIWVSSKSSDPEFFERANKMYDEIEKISSNKQIVIPKNFKDIREGINESKLMLPIAMEGGEAIENDINNLFHFIEKGLLYFGPTWNHSLDWVSSNYDEIYNSSNLKSHGLNEFGKEVINVCQENKVLIDVSHIGEKSFWDIAKISSKPFIASHSSVYNLCPHFRNLKDDQIEEIKKSKGLIGLNPYPFFIDKSFKERENKERKKYSDDLNSIERKYSNKISQWIAKQHFLQKKLADICPSIEIFVDHIEYVINKIGIDYVGIGSDYDGLDC
ncbi:membrane dipeptidase, partial [Pelagibacteraceae bacterium]|nr:membrane dipeptidase [Pelagibacteraceae bacterium]